MKKNYLLKMTAFFVAVLLQLNVSGAEPPFLGSIANQASIKGEAFSLGVTLLSGDLPVTYELTTARPGMSINSSGLITWTPAEVTDGGTVTVKATNEFGSHTRTFIVYVSDEVICPANLVSYWKLDDPEGTVYPDYMGSNDATIITADALVDTTGKIAGAVSFRPTSQATQFLEVENTGQFDWLRSDKFTISLWFKPNGNKFGANQILVAKGEATWLNSWFSVFIEYPVAQSPRVVFEMKPKDTGVENIKRVVHTGEMLANQWNQITVVYHGSAAGNPTPMTMYLNKVRYNAAHTFADLPFSGGSDLTFGYSNVYNQYAFNGVMDEILYYNKAFSDAEAYALYDKSVTGKAVCDPGNFAPVITSTPALVGTQDAAYSYTLTYSEKDGSDVVTLSAVNLPDWLEFNTTTGVLSGTPENEHVGNNEVSLKVSDGKIDVLHDFTIVVANVNDAPVITSVPADTVINQGETFTYTLVAEDIDAGDVITLSAPVLPSWMSFNAETGELSGLATNDQVKFSPDSVFAVRLRVVDLAGEEDIQEFTVRVINVNDPPVILSQNEIVTDEDVPFTITFDDLNVEDIDNYYPVDHTLEVLAGDNYTFSGNTVTPAQDWYGTLEVNIKLSDLEDEVLYTLDVVVNPVNDAPVFTSTPVLEAHEGDLYAYVVVVADVDNTLGELTVTVVQKPAWLNYNAGTKVLGGIPAKANKGDNTVILRVSDGLASSDQEFTIVVTVNNSEPTITSTAITVAVTGQLYTYLLTATDAENDELVMSAPTLPAWLTFDAGTGVLSGTPGIANLGANAVTLEVFDGEFTVSQQFTINVEQGVAVPGVESARGVLLSNVYPNPARENLTFELKNEVSAALYVSDISGRVLSVERIAEGTSKHVLDVSTLAQGVYLYKVVAGSVSETGRFIVK